MRIGLYSFHHFYNNNRMLSEPASLIGDNLMYPFFLLANELKKAGHSVATIDTDDLKHFDAVVFIEFPGLSNKYLSALVKNNFENIYLVALESPIIKPDNYSPENQGYFKKIFTWQDELIDNKKYFKIQYAHHIPLEFDFSLGKKETLCTLIASNKSGGGAQELYSQRVEAIRWFEKNHPDDFYLYGNGWDKYNFQGTLWGIKLARLNRLAFLTKLMRPHYPSYKGPVASKKETYQTYKFAVCYENAGGVKGYITEKIIDCFLAGCVPVYLGAPNITDHIPAGTFIDKRNYPTYEALYDYIKNMPDAEYLGYLDAIKNFLKSEAGHLFSAEHFSKTIIREIT